MRCQPTGPTSALRPPLMGNPINLAWAAPIRCGRTKRFVLRSWNSETWTPEEQKYRDSETDSQLIDLELEKKWMQRLERRYPHIHRRLLAVYPANPRDSTKRSRTLRTSSPTSVLEVLEHHEKEASSTKETETETLLDLIMRCEVGRPFFGTFLFCLQKPDSFAWYHVGQDILRTYSVLYEIPLITYTFIFRPYIFPFGETEAATLRQVEAWF